MLRLFAAINPEVAFIIVLALGIMIYSVDFMVKRLKDAQRPYTLKQKVVIGVSVLGFSVSMGLMVFAFVLI